MIRIVYATLIAAMPLVAIADEDQLAEARAKWQDKDIKSYSFVLERGGPFLTPSLYTPVRVLVLKGKLNSVRYIRSANGVPSGSRAPLRSSLRKTIPDLFELAARELDQPQMDTKIEFDPDCGFPTLISSYASGFDDDGFSYRVSDFKVVE